MARKKELTEEKFLSETQLLNIEVRVQKQKLVQCELRDLDYKIRLFRADIELMKAAIKLKENTIREYQRVVPDYKSKIKEIKEGEREYMKEVKKEMEITSERWGFDPDSGLVKEDNEEESKE